MRTSTLCVNMAGLISGSWKKSYSKLASAFETGTSYSRCVASLEQSSPKNPCASDVTSEDTIGMVQ